MFTDIYQPKSFWRRMELVLLLCCLFSIFYQFFVGMKIVAFIIWLWLVKFYGKNLW